MDFNNVEKYIRDGGNPEEIAQAFADQLNAVLQHIEAEEAVGKKATEVTKVWKDFVEAYFHVNSLPDKMTIEQFYMTEKDVTALLENFVQLTPLIVKYGSALENFANSVQKVVDTKTDKNAFSETMENFFRKLNI